MSVSYDVTLDVRRAGVQATVSGFYVGDTGEKIITAALTKGDMLYRIPEGCGAYLYTVKQDGTHGMYTCSIAGNRIYITPHSQMLTAVGLVRCQIELIGANGNVLYSPEFAVEVSQNGKETSGVESSDEYETLEELINGATGAIRNSHSHDNKTALDSVTADVVSNSHTHANAAVLAQVEAAHLHTHANKTALDKIGEQDGVPMWETKQLATQEWATLLLSPFKLVDGKIHVNLSSGIAYIDNNGRVVLKVRQEAES